MKLKNLIRSTSLSGLFGSVFSKKTSTHSVDPETTITQNSDDRKFWVETLAKIADPVLSNMSRGELKKNMPVEYSPTWDNRDGRVAYMEAFGRLIAGVAPFISLPDDNTAESIIRSRMRLQIQKSLTHAADPKSPDYLYWGDPNSRQPLVDAAFIAQALLAAPKALWEPLDEITKGNLIREFKGMRQIQAYQNNWLLFAAIIETFLLSIAEDIEAPRIDKAIDMIQKWYIGDGWYSDGEKFHFDHYNGFVIHPMLVEVLRVNAEKGRIDKQLFDIAYRRMQRYASFQERYISPEGTYPVFGRSITYRVCAFQPLMKLALDRSLPEDLSPAQVRCALTAVMKRMFINSTFTKEGWLTLSLVGDKQQNIADSYTNTGSLYLTSLGFLPLGLPATDKFWSDPFSDWTQRKAWNGKPFPRDYFVNY